MSLVDWSPSTVMALNVRALASASSDCSTLAGREASVKTKASIVAMSGAIMPEPLAMPLMTTCALPIRAVRVAPLGKVSVVMMAAAACSQPRGLVSAAKAGSAATILAEGGGSPMTPVEAMKTSWGLQPTACAAAWAVRLTVSMPLRPVKALELPELTTTARARPWRRPARHQSTGAEAIAERVKTPAIAVPGSKTASIRSVRPL